MREKTRMHYLVKTGVRAVKMLTTAVALVVTASAAAVPRTPADGASIKLATDIFKQLIEINTTDSVGSTTIAAEAMAKRLRDAGFPAEDVVVLGPNPRKGNMVARLHGTEAHKPVLLIGHLDVVEAKRSDWTTDPFQFIEKDGYYYGRGTQDMKDGDAILMATLIRMKQEGYKPDRDIILALTADEEGGAFNGVDWLVKNHRDLVDAEFVLNHDGGGVEVENGKLLGFTVDASEKLYADYQLSSSNPGGHSSMPTADNAIYHLADAIGRLEHYAFPFEMNAVTRAELTGLAETYPPAKAALVKAVLGDPPDQQAMAKLSAEDPILNSTLRTTCVATRLAAGHANNALPQTATANVNCRIFPGHTREQIRQELLQIVADPKVTVSYEQSNGSSTATAPNEQQLPAVALREDVINPLRKVSAEFWPGLPVVPNMAIGASDSRYTYAAGMPSFGIQGVALDNNDIRAHGKDERLPVASFETGVQFYYYYLKALTTEK
jgi:acetylornithine deacetylase/succinyl-diaminopimelate desuccinylase-like protein